MSFFIVDASKCTKCGICAELCPTEIISLADDGLPQVSEPGAVCIKCGQCTIYCPAGANSLAFQNAEDIVRVSDLALPRSDAGLNLLKTRRSIRRFRPEAVTEQDFKRIFETVKMAPTAQNSQPVRWIAVKNPQKTKEIQSLVLCWFREIIFNEPVSRMGRAGAWAIAKAKEGKDVILRGAPCLVIALTPPKYDWSEDGVIALTYLELAAHAMGIGCCWGGFLTTAIRRYKPLREYLGIDEDEKICGAQMIGYPALPSVRQFPPRKTPNVSWIG